MIPSIELSRKIALAYSAVCKPLCRELELTQTAFDILMFLGNNPDYKTAGDIADVRHIKANLISVNVDRLVKEGYLLRRAVAGDRRKTELICTEKALPVMERGRQLQRAFSERLFSGMDDQMRGVFSAVMTRIGENLDQILEAEK